MLLFVHAFDSFAYSTCFVLCDSFCFWNDFMVVVVVLLLFCRGSLCGDGCVLFFFFFSVRMLLSVNLFDSFAYSLCVVLCDSFLF